MTNARVIFAAVMLLLIVQALLLSMAGRRSACSTATSRRAGLPKAGDRLGRVRARVVAFAGVLLAAGCGSGSPTRSGDVAGTLQALSRAAGVKTVALTPGDGDFSPGPVRFSFLVVANDGRPVEKPKAKVWIARGFKEKPYGRTTARLETIGIPGTSDTSDVPIDLRRASACAEPGHVLGLREATGLGDRRSRQPRRASSCLLAGRRRAGTRRRDPDARVDERQPAGAEHVDASRPRALYAFRCAGARSPPALCRRVRDAEVLHEPDLRSRRRRRLACSEAARACRRRLHPRRGVRAQRPVARLQPLDARVGAAERAVGLPRRPRRSHQGEVRGLAVRERAAVGGRVAARGISPQGRG